MGTMLATAEETVLGISQLTKATEMNPGPDPILILTARIPTVCAYKTVAPLLLLGACADNQMGSMVFDDAAVSNRG